MNILIPYCPKDEHQALDLLNWIAELGQVSARCFLLGRTFSPEMQSAAQRAFTTTGFITDAEAIDSNWKDPWDEKRTNSAEGANSLFKQAGMFFYGLYAQGKNPGAWMFLEPDAIPLCEHWYDKLQVEYATCGKPFMGARVEGKEGSYPSHMTGVAIYPANSFELAGGMFQCQHAAFDVVGAKWVMHQAHFTSQIIHKFRHPGFKTIGEVEEQTQGATVFHSNKDGSLIQLLRAKKRGYTDMPPKPDGWEAPEEAVKVIEPSVGTGAVLDKLVADCRAEEEAAKLLPQDGSMVEVEEEFGGSRDFHAWNRENRVYCYYDRVEGKDRQEHEALIEKWKQAWTEAGWEPIVLGHKKAREHGRYEELVADFVNLPTINNPSYELACWTRWIAMSMVGGFLVDYDVLPFEFTAGDLTHHIEAKCPTIQSANNPVPCAVYGTKAQYTLAAQLMANCAKDFIADEHGKPHISDQQFVQKNPELFPSVDICRQYGSEGWEYAKLVHFSSHSCRPRGRIGTIEFEQRVRVKIATEVLAETKKPVDPVDEAIERLVRYSQGSAPRKAWVTKKLGAAGLIKLKKSRK